MDMIQRHPEAEPTTMELGSHAWWVNQWKDLVKVTNGLLPDDPRLPIELAGLAACDLAYKAKDVVAFQQAAERVRRLMQFEPRATIRWEGMTNQGVRRLGQATVELVHEDGGRLYVFATWRESARWINETIITHIEG
ncbi:MAG: hypothetical protein H0X01_07690, partial [Nitrospira sp.]|nr:hypothetical protein [Nitrospira sp.]